MEYKNRQTGILVLIILGLVATKLIVLYLTVPPAGGERTVLLLVFAVILTAGVIFSSLTTIVSGNELIWYFGPGIWKYRLELNNIRSVKRTKSNPLEGFGLRWNPWKGMLYNVSGLRCIEVTKSNGDTIRIGSNEPESLKKAIEKALSRNRGYRFESGK